MKSMTSESSFVKVHRFPNRVGDLVLLIDTEGKRWTSIASISEITGVSLETLAQKAEAKFWGAAWFPNRGCFFPIERVTEFLNSFPHGWLPLARYGEMAWLKAHAYRLLSGFCPCQQPTTPVLIPEEETPGPRGREKSNLPIHSMPMPEAKVAPVSELLPIRILPLGEERVNAISARDLHAFLESGKDFTTWIKDRIQQYNFIEHQDYEVNDIAPQNRGTVCGSKTEYLLTLDMAKELAMVERNEKGKHARQYFLECERKAKEARNPFLSQIPKTLGDALLLAADLEKKRAALSCKVEEQQATISTLAPKADGLDRLTITTQGTVTLTEAAKLLQQPPRKFTVWLQQIAWVYRSGKHLLPYQDRIHAGMMEHKVVVISEEISVPQAVITPKGLAKLAALLGKVAA